MKTSITEAKELLEYYLKSVQNFDHDCYNSYDDEALITSTRQNLVSISRTVKQIKELAGPSIDSARARKREYDFKNIQFLEDGNNVRVTGEFTPSTPGQTGEFIAVIGYNKNKILKIIEFHDGKPPENKIKPDEIIIEEEK